MADLRNNLREEKHNDRVKNRNAIIEKSRKIDPKEVIIEISNKEEMIQRAKILQQKSSVTAEILISLKNTFLQKPNLIKAFLSVDSALPSILRLLNGQDIEFQMLAAECLCNISLSCDEHEALVITRTFGLYLMVHLDTCLAETSLWITGNLSTHRKCVEALEKLGYYNKVFKLMESTDEGIISAVEYCLKFYIKEGFDFLPENSVTTITVNCVKCLNSKKPNFLLLLSLLSSSEIAQNLIYESGLHLKLLENLADSDLPVIVSTVRLLANAIWRNNGKVALDLLSDLSFLQIIPLLLNTKHDFLKKEIEWLVDNCLNHPLEEVRHKAQILKTTVF